MARTVLHCSSGGHNLTGGRQEEVIGAATTMHEGGALELIYLVCLGIVKAQHNVVSFAVSVRH